MKAILPVIAPGTRFGYLTVIIEEGRNKWRAKTCLCRCDCGATKYIQKHFLLNGSIQSCGCYHSACAAQRKPGLTHGKSGTRTHRCWKSMRQRCTDTSDKYDRYKGRGISVSPLWDSFERFLADMGECPEGLEIDRIDNDGNYEPGNCRWATRTQQMNNTCRSKQYVDARNKEGLL